MFSHTISLVSRSHLSQISGRHEGSQKVIPKEFEGCEITETRMDAIVMPKQDVEFSAPPSPETEEARIKERDRMLDFIQKEGFEVAYKIPISLILIIPVFCVV